MGKIGDDKRLPGLQRDRERGKLMSETMQEMMEREMAEAIATLNRANRAFDRLFGTQEGESDE